SDDAIELFGVARRRQHTFAAPGRAAREIGTLGELAIIMSDNRLGGSRHLADGRIGKVKGSFLVLQKGGIEHRPLMTAIGRDHGKTTRKGGHLASRLRT